MPTIASCLALGCNVHVHCATPGCGRLVVLDAAAIERELGDMDFDELRRRLRCSSCGQRPVDVTPRRELPRGAIRG